MNGIQIGQVAPGFRLPSAQGREIGPEDYRGRSHAIVWFTKGMACPFCRHQMSQLARGYPEFKARNAEVLEVAVTPPDRARVYLEKFGIPFPYLCDPDYRAHRAWGLGVRSHSVGWYARDFLHAMTVKPPPSDFGNLRPSLKEIPSLAYDDDMGFFIVDRQGMVRYALTGSYVHEEGARQIPSNEEIIRELDRCERDEKRARQDSNL